MEEDGGKRQRVMGRANNGRGEPCSAERHHRYHRQDSTARSSPGVPMTCQNPPVCRSLTPIRKLEGDTVRGIYNLMMTEAE